MRGNSTSIINSGNFLLTFCAIQFSPDAFLTFARRLIATSSDGDGISDLDDWDLDNDGIPDYLDEDADGDGVINGEDEDPYNPDA